MASGGATNNETNGEYVMRDGLTEVPQRATTSIAPTDEHARGVSTPHAYITLDPFAVIAPTRPAFVATS